MTAQPVKMLCAILLILGHVLTMGVGRCRTVWFDEPGASGHVGHGHTAEHLHHDDGRYASLLSGDHQHDDELPDHEHVIERDLAERIARTQLSAEAALVTPALYAELATFLTHLSDAKAARGTHPDTRLPHAVPPLPLAGRTANLLF